MLVVGVDITHRDRCELVRVPSVLIGIVCGRHVLIAGYYVMELPASDEARVPVSEGYGYRIW